MCGRMKASDNRIYSAQGWVPVVSSLGTQLSLPWDNFIRADGGRIKQYWRDRGFQPVDVRISAFAERWAPDTWFPVPEGCVVYGGMVVDDAGKPVLKVLTREATPAEAKMIKHHRIPVFGAPRFSAKCSDGVHCEPAAAVVQSKGLLEDPMDFVKSGPMDRQLFHVPY